MRFHRRAAFAVSCTILMALGFASAANAAGDSATLPIAGVIDSPCTGEPIAITGTSHMTFNGSDGHVTSEANLQGVTGTGLLSGLRYVEQTQQTEWSRFTADGSAAGHFEFTDHLIRQRELAGAPLMAGDDLYAKILLHVVFDAHGTPTVRQDMSDGGCR